MIDQSMIECEVVVSEKYLEVGIPGSGCHCPVAMAIKDHVQADVYVSMGLNSVLFGRHNDEGIDEVVLQRPEVVWSIIRDVDRGYRPTKAVRFPLPIPARFVRSRSMNARN